MRKNVSIKRRLEIAVSGLCIISVLVSSVVIIRNFSKELQDNMKKNVVIMTDYMNSQIDSFFSNPRFVLETCITYLQRTDLANQDEIESFFAEMTKKEETFEMLYFASELPCNDGGFLYSDVKWRPPVGWDQTTRVWFKQAHSTKGFFVAAPYIDDRTGAVVVTVGEKVEYENKTIGVIAMDMRINNIGKIAKTLNITESGTSFLLDSDGLYLNNDATGKILKDNFFQDYKLSISDIKSLPIGETYVSFKEENDIYFATRRLPSNIGWTFVTIGPCSEINGPIQRAMKNCAIITVIVVIFAWCLSILISKKLIKTIFIVKDAVTEISTGNADLTKRIDYPADDEMGTLVNKFNDFVIKLQSIVTQIKASKNDLGTVKDDLQTKLSALAESLNNILSNITQVDSNIEEQSLAVEQTSDVVTDISNNINSLDNLVEKQSRGVNEASTAIEEMIGNISSVNESVEKMSSYFNKLTVSSEEGLKQQETVIEQIRTVAEQSQSLQEANTSIANVAEQTNLLAMNAAIEAAHAGESGKGFSVVADEIRKLSEDSGEQSAKITQELSNIQETITNVVSSVSVSAESFTKVSELINTTSILVEQIHTAMEEQTSGSKRILEVLNMMTTSTKDVKNASSTMNNENSSIVEKMKNLQKATEQIKNSVQQMNSSASIVGSVNTELTELSKMVNDSIGNIGNQIDQFKA